MAMENGSLMSVKKLDDIEQKIEKKNTEKIAAATFLFTFLLCWRGVFFFVSFGLYEARQALSFQPNMMLSIFCFCWSTTRCKYCRAILNCTVFFLEILSFLPFSFQFCKRFIGTAKLYDER